MSFFLAPVLTGQESSIITHKNYQAIRISKSDVPVKINVPGAIARQELDFGDASGYSKIAGEYFTLGAVTDIADLLKGLENDVCQSPVTRA